MKSFAINLLLAVTLCGSAWGQTTQPAVDPWPEAVERLARAIADGQVDILRSMLTSDASIHSFDSNASEDDTRLLARGSLTTLIGAHAYIHPPMVMAADVAVDCKNSPSMPEALREKMAPKDDVEMQRANATAAQWLTHKLGATDGDHVGVIVLYWNGESSRSGTSVEHASPELIFVLVSGTSPDLQNFQIRTIVYGNPIASSP